MTDRGQGMTAKQLLKVLNTTNPYGPGKSWVQNYIDTVFHTDKIKPNKEDVTC